eukprot:7307768-Pyramimonas_sp.AAC.1
MLVRLTKGETLATSTSKVRPLHKSKLKLKSSLVISLRYYFTGPHHAHHHEVTRKARDVRQPENSSNDAGHDGNEGAAARCRT